MMKPGRSKPGHPDAWQKLEALIHKPEGKPTLVPEDDPRDAITRIPDADKLFDEED
jgi:hypothetical protein